MLALSGHNRLPLLLPFALFLLGVIVVPNYWADLRGMQSNNGLVFFSKCLCSFGAGNGWLCEGFRMFLRSSDLWTRPRDPSFFFLGGMEELVARELFVFGLFYSCICCSIPEIRANSSTFLLR
jgi:hypothetical protein